jgi:hypothetical protein
MSTRRPRSWLRVAQVVAAATFLGLLVAGLALMAYLGYIAYTFPADF